MKKLKLLQFSFLFTAVAATVLFLCAPLHIVPVLYAVLFFCFVLIPQVVSILFQIEILKHHIIEYQKALEEYYGHASDREKHTVLLPSIWAEAIRTFAALKAEGINPNRAGPFKIYA